MNDLEKSLRLNSVGNARQLGGYINADGKKVRNNVLLRTGHLGNITDGDIARLRDVYNLGDIIDMRTSVEISGNEDKKIDGANYHHISIMDESSLLENRGNISIAKNTPEGLLTFIKTVDKLHIFRDDMYINFLEGECGISGYRKFFDILLSSEDGKAVLWHCTSGKDRTGLGAMLILTVLGVDEKTILEDYMLTNRYNKSRIDNTRKLILESNEDNRLVENIALFGGVYEKFMTIALDHLKENYGSVMGYIKSALVISDSDISELKHKYLGSH